MNTPLQTSFVCSALVGRETYLDALPTVLDEVRRGQGATLLISGEAGIGKSRMLRAIRELAQVRGFNVIQGHCFEHDSSVAYGPLLDALRSCEAKATPPAIRDTLKSSGAELARLLPQLARETADGIREESPALGADAEKRRLFRALVRFFIACAEATPLLLVLEDLHWCDEVSLEFLAQLAQRLTGQPLLLALTYRANEVRPPLRHLLAEMDRTRIAIEWPLTPLDEAQVEAMLRAIFGQANAMPGDVLKAIYTPTEGNPFFVEELLKALVVSGDLVFEDGTWSPRTSAELRTPRSVQDTVQRRMGEFSARAREVLRIAAVVGQRIDFEVLRSLTEYEDAELLLLTKELIAAQLMIEVSAEQLGFRHALTRRAVYGELMARERRALHSRVATTLEQLYAQSVETHLGELGYHTFEAGMWREALEYARRAGEQSLALYAPMAALNHYARVFEAAERLAQSPDPRVLLGRGKAYELLGEFVPALKNNQQALDAARSAADRDGEWRALSAIGFLWVARDYARAGEFFQAALEAAQALGDEKLSANSLNRRANWLVNTGKAAEGVALHREALELFQRLGDQLGIAQTYDLLAMASGIYGDAIGATQSASKAISLLGQLGDTVNLTSSYTTRAAFGNSHLLEPVYSALPSPEDCERDLADAMRLARQIGSRSAEGYTAFTACTTSFAFGDFANGVARGREALRVAEEAEHTQWIVAAHHAMAFGYGVFLLPDLALAHAEVALRMANEMGSDWWSGNVIATRGAAQLDGRTIDDLEASLLAFLPVDRAPGNLSERRIRMVWGRLQLARGDADAALATADDLLATVPGNGGGQPIPRMLLLRGQALVALGREDDALLALESALRGALLRHELHSEWRVRAALAALYLRCARQAAAEHEAAQTHALIDALAATVDDITLRQRFVRAAEAHLPQGLKPVKVESATGGEKAARATAGGLTQREREVATLVARGLANRAIADELVVSERTVESHVTNILGKLSFSSRAQIAAWATRQDSSIS